MEAARETPGYHASLDGLRALCLLAVFLFHSDFAWMSGGFLGVSTFFTLSGFLITSLLAAEWSRTGDVSIGGFWDRRLRRLLPAAVIAIAGVVVTAPYWLPRAQQERLASDAIAALFYVVNWRFVQAEYAYDLIFTDPSPLQHFWSLAIEAQFYLFFPLFAAGLLRWGGGLRVVAGLLLALAVVSVALSFAPPLVADGAYRLYYGSDTRAAEILIGGLAALWIADRREAGRGVPPKLAALGLPALVAIVVCWSFAAVEDAWLYHGGFAAYALASAVVVVGATEPTLVRSALSPAWLRWVGRVSYGAYLYHWPVFLFLSEERTGLSPAALFAVRCAVTLSLAGLSARLVEEPVRRRRLLPGRRFGAASAAALAVVALCALAWSPVPLAHRWGAVAAFLQRQEAPATPEGGPVRWALFGDSTALSLAPGLQAYTRDRPREKGVPGKTALGCGVLDRGWFFNRGDWREVKEKCRKPAEKWADAVAKREIDVAVVLTGPWESRDWRFENGGPEVWLGVEEFDQRVQGAIGEIMDSLRAAGAHVVWLTAPHVGIPPNKKSRSFVEAARPERQDRLNELIVAEARARPDVHVVDLAGFVRTWPGGAYDESLRHDHTHFSAEGAAVVMREFIGPEILRLFPR